MIFLEWLDFGSFLDFIIKVIATTGISMLLIFTVELLFPGIEIPDKYSVKNSEESGQKFSKTNFMFK